MKIDEEIKKMIIDLLDKGNTSEEARDQVCQKYKINHGNYNHLFYSARQEMIKRD